MSADLPSAPLTLAGEFPAATDEQWRALVEGVLAKSGQQLSDLDSTTLDGITVQPLYTAAQAAAETGLPGQAPYVRGATATGAAEAGWDVRQLHADPDPKATNSAVLDDLAAGATSVWLRGVDPADYASALDGVYLDLAPVALDAGADTVAAATALFELAAARGVAPAELRGTLGADPVRLAARTETAPDLSVLADLAARAAAYPNLQLATVDGTVLHDAGATDAQELAYATSVGVAYLRALTEAGLSVDEALNRIEFRFALTDAQFPSIAKLRAARRLWARVAELCAGANQNSAELSSAAAAARGQRQHAVTSAAMLTKRDPWVNMLRTTIACFSAAIGGADAITVLPFDHAIGLPDELARRVARNTQSILHDESSLARVLDAGGGSYFLETLTDELAHAAWDKFIAIERVGGIGVALASGAIADEVAAARQAREREIADRSRPITGVSEFALITEEALVRRPAPLTPVLGGLPPHRYAEAYEALRDRCDAHLAETGARPRVFLAALGPVSAYTGRLGFASNFFQAAGIEAVVGTGTPDDIVAAFTASGTSSACLCSSDKVYADEAGATAAALRAAGARVVGLAGQPGDRLETYRSAGIDGYIYVGVDVVDILKHTLDMLGVK